MRAGSKLFYFVYAIPRRAAEVFAEMMIHRHQNILVQCAAVWMGASMSMCVWVGTGGRGCRGCLPEVLSVYLFLSCSLLISLVWTINCFSSLLVEREFSSSWISSLDVWFRTSHDRKYTHVKNTIITAVICFYSNYSSCSKTAEENPNTWCWCCI